MEDLKLTLNQLEDLLKGIIPGFVAMIIKENRAGKPVMVHILRNGISRVDIDVKKLSGREIVKKVLNTLI